MTDQDDKRARRELLGAAKKLPALQKLLLRILNNASELARVAPDEAAGERAAIERMRARIDMCQEDVDRNRSFALSLGDDLVLTEVLAANASLRTELRHCAWIFEPLSLELRNTTNDWLGTALQQLHADCLPLRAWLASAAAREARHEPQLREALEVLAVERCVAAYAGGADVLALEQLIFDDFPQLSAAYSGHERALEELVAGVARGKPQLYAALRRAGVRVIVPTHARLLHVPTKHDSLHMVGAILDAFAALDEVRQDIDALYRICKDIIDSETKRAMRRRWSKEDCLAIAGELLCRVRERSQWAHLASFRAYFRIALKNALGGAPPDPRGGGCSGEPIRDEELGSPAVPEVWDSAERAALIGVLDLCVCELWPERGRAKERRRFAQSIIEALRSWTAQEDTRLEFREFVGELQPNNEKRIDKVRERMRGDIASKIADACRSAGCAEVAPPLEAVLIHYLDPTFVSDTSSSFPHAVRDLRAAKHKLENAKRKPVWLCGLVDWLIDFLEGRL